MLHYAQIAGRDVWVTVEAPMVQVEGSQDYLPGGFWVSAFRFDHIPGVITGEFIKDSDGRIRRFSSSVEAVASAVDEARSRLHVENTDRPRNEI